MTGEIKRIAAEVERLEGPSREMDAEIARAVGWTLHTFHCTNINGSTEVGELWLAPNCTDEWRDELVADCRSRVAANLWPESEPPAYTASLDAAMTLVPEGAFWSITMRGERRGGFHACCQLEGPLDWREAATPALALCAAALKARAHLEQHHAKD